MRYINKNQIVEFLIEKMDKINIMKLLLNL